MEWTKTKTAVVVSVSVLLVGGGALIIAKACQAKKASREALRTAAETARKADSRPSQWAEEKKAEAERIQARQKVNETRNAATIDLKPYITARLTEAPLCWKGNNGNNLAELPAGEHVFAGVPFDVSGSVQLMGGWLKRYKKTYPTEVSDIPIERKCTRLHLLHGHGFITHTNFGTVVARLVIHYENGSSNHLDLVAGENAFDWWYPLFKTGIPERLLRMAPGTERAWTGSNAHIRQWQPDLSLILYKTTFENPRPELKVASVDYVSTETITCPFMVGLTVE
jgi:hypothetical protein